MFSWNTKEKYNDMKIKMFGLFVGKVLQFFSKSLLNVFIYPLTLYIKGFLPLYLNFLAKMFDLFVEKVFLNIL